MRFFLFLFIAIPIVEIYVLVTVGQHIGGLATVALILATAFIGLSLLKQQGYKAMATAQAKLDRGALPAKELVDGIFLAVGGALLLTPGFVTDAIGFFCLIPGLRHGLILGLLKRLKPASFNASFRSAGPEAHGRGADSSLYRGAHTSDADPSKKQGHVIDGQYHRDDD